MPTSVSGKTIASRNATTHGLFARDVVLPALGEDPEGYRQLEAEWMTQLPPRTLLERHYIEKIAAASWRLRRLHRWQAQILENNELTEDEQLDKLAKVLRHETTLHRQIDTAVKMLNKDAPQLFSRRVRDAVLEDARISERECLENPDFDFGVTAEIRDRMGRLHKATAQVADALSLTATDTEAEEVSPQAPENVAAGDEICENELPGGECAARPESQNKPASLRWNPRRIAKGRAAEFLDPAPPYLPRLLPSRSRKKLF